MPLPDHALTFHGGCNCKAIRYRVDIPPLASRPLNPFSTPDDPVHFPMIATDHCNDCRTATGSILPTWICVPADMMTVSIRPAPPPEPASPNVDINNGPWRPAMEVLKAGSVPADEKSTVRYYGSSPKITRTFCGNCGTNLTYQIFPMVEGYPDIFDTVLGTIDRENLEKEWFVPDRQCWWSLGVPWVQKFSSEGLKVPKHPIYKVNELVG